MNDGVTVYADVVGDLFHLGHVALLRTARSMGDKLIVGVHADDDVASYKRSPILTMEERSGVIEACRYVDSIIPAAPLIITHDFLAKHAIDIVVHGDDIDETSLARSYGVPLGLGIMRLVPYSETISSSDIIRRIRQRETTASMDPSDVAR